MKDFRNLNIDEKLLISYILLDVEITLKTDTLQNIASKRAFVYDNVTDNLVETFVRNVTFTRGGFLPFEHTIYVSVEVSIFLLVHLKKNLIEFRYDFRYDFS